MDPEYGALYRELYERHWWWRAREAVILDELSRLRPAGDWGRILDVGCGDGLFFPRLSELGEVVGVEPEAALLSDRPREGEIHWRGGATEGLRCVGTPPDLTPDAPSTRRVSVASWRHVGLWGTRRS